MSPMRFIIQCLKKPNPKLTATSTSGNTITDTTKEAAHLHLRSELMDKITALTQKNGWTQLEAAKHCSVTQPRINELLRGRFSLDALLNIAAHVGQRVHVELQAV